MDLSTLVRTVICAFEDASDLVIRLRDQRLKAESAALAEEPTQDLIESLTLGPVIIRGHYDHDFKRFKEQYACGDNQAREQMKDVLINLQMTVITALRSVHIHEEDLDLAAIQTASDDCRVNAGVCLGQLSQRLSDLAKAEAMCPANLDAYGLRRQQKGLSITSSSTRSSQSSTTYTSATTPDQNQDKLSHINDTSTLRPLSEHAPSPSWSPSYSDCQSPLTRQPPKHQLLVNEQIPAASLDKSMLVEADSVCLDLNSATVLAAGDDGTRNLSATPKATLPLELPTPTSPAVKVDPENNVQPQNNSLLHHQPNTDSPAPILPSIVSTSVLKKDRHDPDDFDPESDIKLPVYRTMYDMTQTIPIRTSTLTQRQPTSLHNNSDRIRFLQENSRPPLHGINRIHGRGPSTRSTLPDSTTTIMPDSRYTPCSTMQEKQLATPGHMRTTSDTTPTSPNLMRSPTHSSTVSSVSDPRTSISTRTSTSGSEFSEMPTPYTTSKSLPSIPRLSHMSQLLHRSATTASVTTNTSTSSSSSQFLGLPTDKNLHGFCKGAFRLQVGLEKKAFRIANRPLGYSGMIPYWKCDKCNFEGPSYNSVVIEGKKRGKAEKCFDPRVRLSATGGVRYRWSFLAKSHSTLKAFPDGPQAREGTFGSFGCLFCCAEGNQRGWNRKNDGNGLRLDRVPTSLSGRTSSITGNGSSGTGAPIFGNVDSFMEHLEMHRREECWPNAEMLGRTKCVVGRVARDDEEWDINFAPL